MEGWFENPDGTQDVHRRLPESQLEQEVDVPIGDEQQDRAGRSRLGQPTHFMPHRQLGMFTITVPKDFGRSSA